MIPLPLSAKLGIVLALLAGAVGLGWQARGRWDGETVARLEGENAVLRLRVGVTDRSLDTSRIREGQLEQALADQSAAVVRLQEEGRRREAQAARDMAAERERAGLLRAQLAVRPLSADCDEMVRQLAEDMALIWPGGAP